MTALKSFIKTTLNEYVPSLVGDKLEHYLSDDSMEIWKQAFTHESYDPEPSNNYEPLETEGDRVLDLVFTSYIMKYYKQYLKKEITPQFITNLKHYYMSKMQQGELSEKLNLPSQILISPLITIDINIVEDLFESFFGALYQIGNNLIYGFGMMTSYSFFEMLFNDVDIDENKRFGDSKTIVIQMFEQMGWGKEGPTVKTTSETDQDGKISHIVSLSFNQASKDYLQPLLDKKKYKIPDIITTKKSPSIRRAENDAYSFFELYLSKIGITRDYVKKFREKQVFQVYGDLYVMAKNKSQRQGYKSLSFNQQRTGVDKKKFYVQLIGLSIEDKSVMLDSALGDTAAEGRQKVLENYTR
jgi:dsRNA-specific ribonuclease